MLIRDSFVSDREHRTVPTRTAVGSVLLFVPPPRLMFHPRFRIRGDVDLANIAVSLTHEFTNETRMNVER